MKLATAEDFEKKLKALQDRKSKWGDFYICFFRYCGDCRKVVPTRGSGGLEGYSENCLVCDRDIDDSTRIPMEIQEQVGKEVSRRFTRAGQLEFFYELLEKTITEQKGIARGADKMVRKLAALRRS